MNRLNIITLRRVGGLLLGAMLGVALFGCNALSGASSNEAQGFGPNMLTSQPVFWTDPTAQATRDIEGRSYTFRISSTGPKPWGVQQYWVVPPPNAGDKMRVQFEAQGTRGMDMVVKFQRNGPPFDVFGLEQTVPLTADWKRHEIEFTTNGTTDECQLIFWCSSVPGTVSIRSVTLQKKELANAPIKSGGAPQPVKSISELFDYYDLYVARFKDKDATAITSAWAPGYQDYFGDTMPSSSKEIQLAGRERLELQMGYSGQYTNGPDRVFATSLTTTGDTTKVTGYRAGSFKFVTPEGGLQAGGSSFSHTFTDTWTLKGGVWSLRKTVKEKYVDPSKELFAASEKAHEALKAKYGGKKPAPSGVTAKAGLVSAFGKSRSAYEQILGAGRLDENVTEQRDYLYTWKGKDVVLTLFNAGEHVDNLTLHQAGATWQEAVRLLDLDPASLKAGKQVNGDTPIEGLPGGAKALFVPVGNDGGSLMISMPKPSTSGAAAPAVSSVFLGTLFINGQPSTGSDFKSNAAKSVRLTIDKAGTYKLEQVSSGNVRIDGGAMLIASGKATWKDNVCTLSPDKMGPSSLSVCGWSFNKPLTLKYMDGGSLALLGKPNGLTDPLPRGEELRFY